MDGATAPQTGPQTAPAEVLVCISCRAGDALPDAAGHWPGRRLYDALAARGLPAGVRLRPVECLQNCTRGCTVAFRGPGRWTYVYGNCRETSDSDMLAQAAARYQATPDGLVPWRERPEHLKRNCIARLPPETFPDPALEPAR